MECMLLIYAPAPREEANDEEREEMFARFAKYTGPFAETKEWLAGYYKIEVESIAGLGSA